MTTKKKEEEKLHLEALPKAVKRALRATDTGLSVVECRLSNNAEGEHGKTTLVYTHRLNDGEHITALNQLTKQTAIEQDHLLRDDEEDA